MTLWCTRRPLAAGANAVLLHQSLHAQLACPEALSPQLPPDARPAVGSPIFRIHGPDVQQQQCGAKMTALNNAPVASQVFMIASHAHP